MFSVSIALSFSAKASLTNNTIHINMYTRMTDLSNEVFDCMANSPKLTFSDILYQLTQNTSVVPCFSIGHFLKIL